MQFDLRVLKFFKVGEHGKLDFVVESFNLLNHTNVVALNQFYGAESSPIPAFADACGSSPPCCESVDVLGLAFEDFEHDRGHVATLWELHPAIVTLH